jgi:hypothetical protein
MVRERYSRQGPAGPGEGALHSREHVHLRGVGARLPQSHGEVGRIQKLRWVQNISFSILGTVGHDCSGRERVTALPSGAGDPLTYAITR